METARPLTASGSTPKAAMSSHGRQRISHSRSRSHSPAIAVLVVFVMISWMAIDSHDRTQASVLAFAPQHQRQYCEPRTRRATKAASVPTRRLPILGLAASSTSLSRSEPTTTSLPDGDSEVNHGSSKVDDGRSDDIIASIIDYFRDPADGDSTSDGASAASKSNQPRRKRGNIQLVAGSGKTYVAWKAMEPFLVPPGDSPNDSMRIGLYVTPYLNLIDQALSNREDHNIMGDSANGGTERRVETMIVAGRTSRKQERCTTKVEEILDFLTDPDIGSESNGLSKEGQVSKVLVSTYKSLPRVGAALEQWREDGGRAVIDFAIFDEAHKMEGLNPSSSNGTAYGLYDSNIDIRNRLFMTGTPNNYTQNARVMKCLPSKTRPDGTRMFLLQNKDHAPDRVGSPRIRSFSDEALFGPCLAQKTHQDSVEQNITLPISLLGVETEAFRQYDVASTNRSDAMSEKDYFMPLAIKSAFQKFPIKHAVSFHSTNLRARDFIAMAEDVLNSGDDEDIQLFNMDHKTSPSQRSEILQEARESPRSLISNCKLLSMGVDEASWDLAVIADPVRSSVDGRQMIGRVGRKAPGKERGYVLVPVPVGKDLLEGTSNPNYQIFVNTFQHMVSLNPELRRDVLFVIAKSKELRRPLTQSEYPPGLLNTFEFPETMALDLQYQLMDRAIVEYDSTERNIIRWNKMFGLLATYKGREGDCNVPGAHKEDGQPLGLWVKAQRKTKKKGTLDQDLEERLTSLGFTWDPLAEQWESMFILLQQYKEKEGDCKVPGAHKEDGQTLGTWVNTQRMKKRKGILDDDLEERLTSLGFTWDVFAEQWESMFMLLQQYKENEGDCNVPMGHKEDGQALGAWVGTQRRYKTEGILDQDLEERLTSLGFTWDVLAEQWESMFMLLQQYKEREGDCNVPKRHIEDGQNLGFWVQYQRDTKKKGTLDDDLEERLTSLGFTWDPLAEQWESMFMLLQQYKEREGDCKVPGAHKEDGQTLGRWVNTQRQKKKKGILDDDLEERLTSLGFTWDAFTEQWESMFMLLQQYKEREGDCKVPGAHKEDEQPLGRWVKAQRKTKKKGTLDQDLEERLTSLGFTWDPLAEQWESMFILLQQYKEKEGDCKVPGAHKEDGQTLGTWVNNQRMKKRKGILDDDLEERLTGLGFTWDVFAEQWESMFMLLQQYKENEGDCNVPMGHKEDGQALGAWVGTQRRYKTEGILDQDLEERLTSLGFTWDVLAEQWESMFMLLQQYKENEGDCNVPDGHIEDGQPLGRWVITQRMNKRKGTLDDDLEERLTSLGFTWDVLAEQWESMFMLLQQYKEKEGDCNVPKGHIEDGQTLGTWVNTQRMNKKKGTLDQDRKRRLTSLGFTWDPLAEQWESMFMLLQQYKEKEGDCNVPDGHIEDGQPLGRWVITQRMNKKKGILDQVLEERLTSLGFTWDPLAEQWESMFMLLQQYKEKEGDCNVPKRHIEDGQTLGRWVKYQRETKKKGTLDWDLEERLTSLGFTWDPLAEQWESMFMLLQQYKEKKGDCNVPKRHIEDGQNLGFWVQYQRDTKKKGILDDDLEERLTSLGFTWDPFAEQWESMFMLLQQYKEREGDCKVPGAHKEEGQNLGSWVNKQRMAKKKGILDQDLEERLTNLGFTWDVFAEQWESMFMLLQQYKEKEGDCNVPMRHKEDGQALGAWVGTQRRYKTEGILDQDLEERLTSLGFTWDVLAEQWESMFMLLQQYKEREGDCKVPGAHKEEGQNLGSWVNKQRMNKKKGILDEDLEERLTNLGFTWDVYVEQGTTVGET